MLIAGFADDSLRLFLVSFKAAEIELIVRHCIPCRTPRRILLTNTLLLVANAQRDTEGYGCLN